jgi:hypothetical protein
MLNHLVFPCFEGLWIKRSFLSLFQEGVSLFQSSAIDGEMPEIGRVDLGQFGIQKVASLTRFSSRNSEVLR